MHENLNKCYGTVIINVILTVKISVSQISTIYLLIKEKRNKRTM